MGFLFEITSSKRVFKEEWTKQGIPFYRAREIVSIKNKTALKDPIFISRLTYNNKISISGIPKANDLLITGVGTLGITYKVKDNFEFHFKDGNIIWLKNIISTFINIDYIELFIESPYSSNIINNSKGTTVGTLTINKTKSLFIAMPPLSEQKRIVNKIAQINNVLCKLNSG